MAKNLVNKGFADNCEVQVAYGIGLSQPISIEVFGSLNKPKEEILTYINNNFDLRPGKIIDTLNLLKPIYQSTSSYGHFGREATGDLFTWEKLL